MPFATLIGRVTLATGGSDVTLPLSSFQLIPLFRRMTRSGATGTFA